MNVFTNSLGFLATADRGLVSEVWFPQSASTFAHDHDMLFLFIFWISVFFFVLLMGLSLIFVIKYRRMPGKPQQRSMAHNTPLELTWSIGPLAILAVIFFWGFDKFMDMHVTPADAEVIDLTAFQWGWEMNYENGASATEFSNIIGTVDSPIFAIPVGKPIKLRMISRDVIHSFWAPNFRVKFDVFPNRYTTMWFEATEPGDHHVFCAEYCGAQHSEMAAILRAMPPADYAQWKVDNAISGESMPPVELGKRLYVTKACNSCHSVDGSAKTGPTWQGTYGTERTVLVNGSPQTVTIDDNYIRESILDPEAKIAQGYPNQMLSYQGQLKDFELTALVAYIKSLSEQGREELESESETEGEEGEGAADDEQGVSPEA